MNNIDDKLPPARRREPTNPQRALELLAPHINYNAREPLIVPPRTRVARGEPEPRRLVHPRPEPTREQRLARTRGIVMKGFH